MPLRDSSQLSWLNSSSPFDIGAVEQGRRVVYRVRDVRRREALERHSSAFLLHHMPLSRRSFRPIAAHHAARAEIQRKMQVILRCFFHNCNRP
jgi:hypothetical protein